MKTITKIVLFASVMIFTACSKGKDDTKPKVAKEITAKELAEYFIIGEYTPKPEYASSRGTKPILIYTYFQQQAGNRYLTRNGDAHSLFNDALETELSYSSETGITTLKTAFGNYELSRDDSEQIIVKKSNHDVNSAFAISLDFTSSYIQLVKATDVIYYNNTYKEISGTGYYSFSTNYWRYKQGAHPALNELTWIYNHHTNTIWYGRDGGTANYYNLFFILPRGSGWKGLHKDKELLIVNTLDNIHYKATGNIGIYTLDN